MRRGANELGSELWSIHGVLIPTCVLLDCAESGLTAFG